VSPSQIDPKVLATKKEAIREMLRGIETLPLESLDAFTADDRMVAAGESYLRRALEALLDLGRHVLAKGFGIPVPEYAAIADSLRKVDILTAGQTGTLRKMARYRNRMVHFYYEISSEELYANLTEHVGDFDTMLEALDRWLSEHPSKLRQEL
jgi:uncharacterized protein YutE (UPF0331/DUF86 family)